MDAALYLPFYTAVFTYPIYIIWVLWFRKAPVFEIVCISFQNKRKKQKT